MIGKVAFWYIACIFLFGWLIVMAIKEQKYHNLPLPTILFIGFILGLLRIVEVLP